VAEVDAAGVAAGVVGVVAAEVAVGLADGARISDKVKVTGNGHPPLDDDEPPLEPVPDELEPVALLEVEAKATDPTPWTRPSATMVAATADWLAAQPPIWTACVVEGEEVVVPEAAAAAVESDDGEVACNELRAASAGITPPIWLRSGDHGKRPVTSCWMSASCCFCCWAAVTYEA
jgi:hypothetical protein